IAGVIKHNVRSDKMNTIEPVIRITGYKIDFKEPDKNVSNQNERFDAILNYHQNNITFDFIGVSLTNPGKVKYSYKLEGIDKSWTPPASGNSITYQNIPPGDYVFLVKACNSDGLWNITPATFSFAIRPPFWQTSWFYT